MSDNTENQNNTEENPKRKFLGIWFSCCNVYGRLYPNKQGTHYVGSCPRCLRRLSVRIGNDGTNRRFFRAE
ncbi:hypothetical protein IJI31_03865 [bacterium]|nr:hypothetical protein [bacterium]